MSNQIQAISRALLALADSKRKLTQSQLSFSEDRKLIRDRYLNVMPADPVLFPTWEKIKQQLNDVQSAFEVASLMHEPDYSNRGLIPNPFPTALKRMQKRLIDLPVLYSQQVQYKRLERVARHNANIALMHLLLMQQTNPKAVPGALTQYRRLLKAYQQIRQANRLRYNAQIQKVNTGKWVARYQGLKAPQALERVQARLQKLKDAGYYPQVKAVNADQPNRGIFEPQIYEDSEMLAQDMDRFRLLPKNPSKTKGIRRQPKLRDVSIKDLKRDFPQVALKIQQQSNSQMLSNAPNVVSEILANNNLQGQIQNQPPPLSNIFSPQQQDLQRKKDQIAAKQLQLQKQKEQLRKDAEEIFQLSQQKQKQLDDQKERARIQLQKQQKQLNDQRQKIIQENRLRQQAFQQNQRNQSANNNGQDGPVDTLKKYSKQEGGSRVLVPPQRNFQDVVNNYSNKFSLQRKYNLKDGNLQAFPQWIASETEKRQKQSGKFGTLMANAVQIQSADSALFNNLNQLDPALATYDQQLRKWRGSVPQMIESKVTNGDKGLKKKMAASAKLLAKVTSRQVINKQVPTIVQQIVDANKALSTTGFGKISASKTGGDLYAGRWIDQTTGKVRLLPNANSKYLNPLSKEQKLGYLQAKILNHWNNLLSSQEQYRRLKDTDDEVFKTRVINSLRSGLDFTNNLSKFCNFINDKIVKFVQQGYPNNSMTRYILMTIDYVQLMEIYQLLPGKIQDDSYFVSYPDKKTAAIEKIDRWQTAIQSATKTLSDLISNSGLDDLNQEKLLVKLNQTGLDLLTGPVKSIKSTFKRLQKIAIIPQKLTQKDIMGVVQKYNMAQTSFRRLTDGTTMRGLDSRNIGAFGSTAESLLKSVQQAKTLGQASNAITSAATTLRATLGTSQKLDRQVRLPNRGSGMDVLYGRSLNNG